ncbi:helix-turn-helix domain-containing protein [Nocardia cyriacigeorgica]|uniref:Helix-turn-helix domain-containing protein n=1 Tax=Nocardia cyriacigeorgica TaxID=135487 RepID=A0ABX0CEN2_9NOCA|nr:helix-turn-helix transcriptional regulator [Nocardia cyriacigeorgica]NEW42771.1 helix-turn-helix domain-containing protein [Nocardia cyriacigeorgica]NEW53934.1 helix-turn-helix domain-containing protein [Nocardia cyriacigeorgica]NEW54477.1 helix-turn-helix domain-containing protein [Nocardia cyriacigeorgica]
MEDKWPRLGRLIRERRDELRLTQSQVQERGGPSPALVRKVETGKAESMSRSKRRDLERALEWRIGSVDDILRGGDPAPASEPIDIPNITHHPNASDGGGYEVTRDLGGFEPLKLFGLVLLTDALNDAAEDFAKGDAGPERLIALAHKSYNASIDVLAEVLGVDAEEARTTVRRLGYMFDDVASVEGNPTK